MLSSGPASRFAAERHDEVVSRSSSMTTALARTAFDGHAAVAMAAGPLRRKVVVGEVITRDRR